MDITHDIAQHALERLKDIQRDECFSPERMDLSATPAQLEILQSQTPTIYAVGGNRSGKSQVGGRIATWWFNNAHPHFDHKKEWGNGPYTFLVLGRVGGQIENEIYLKKIKPLLKVGTYKEHRIGGILQWISHKENGNRLIFQSHHNLKEAREKVQAYTLQGIWVDEQAESASFLMELQTRLFTTNGRLICTFTPLVRSEEVREMVDGSKLPYSQKFKLKMFDNPIFIEDPKKIAAVMAQYAHYSEAERNTRLNGDWFVGSKSVYDFNSETMIKTPEKYSYVWRHVLGADPAMSGKCGVVVMAEDPCDGVWYVIHDDYFEGILDPVQLVTQIRDKYTHLNIVRQVADTHETWFFRTATTLGEKYWSIHKKKDRKHELIKNLQKALSDGRLKIAGQCRRLINELTTCQWSETVDNRIVGASKYHLLDATQYDVDILPKFVPDLPVNNQSQFDTWLRMSNIQRKQKERRKLHKITRGGRRSWK